MRATKVILGLLVVAIVAVVGIPNPSNRAVSVGDEGELELLLTLGKR